MRFKNFSRTDLVIPWTTTNWTWGDPVSGRIGIEQRIIVEAGDVTTDFDPEDPVVQLMLKAHPELRPIVVPSVWERLRQPSL
jgi:hypothetical protein